MQLSAKAVVRHPALLVLLPHFSLKAVDYLVMRRLAVLPGAGLPWGEGLKT
jgi:hypothetical protein